MSFFFDKISAMLLTDKLTTVQLLPPLKYIVPPVESALQQLISTDVCKMKMFSYSNETNFTAKEPGKL